jgi:glycosyltransferase involved in cell wall biosynthesis
LLFNEPNPGMGILGYIWVENVKQEVKDIIRDKKIKKVIISGPHFSLFKVAEFIKQQSNDVKVILDYRDPWNLWNNAKGFSYMKEKKYLHIADRIVVFSDAFRRDMINEFNIEGRKICTVMNGYSEGVWNSLKSFEGCRENGGKGKLIMSYIGSIDLASKRGHRNPLELLKAYKEFKYNYDIVLRFIGVINSPTEIENIKETFGNSLEIRGQISYKDSLLEMMRSDVLLLLNTENCNFTKYVYNAKFFDYLKSGKVIWGIGKQTVLLNELIEKYKLGIISENSKKEILEKVYLLHKYWKSHELNTLRKNELLDISIYSREHQNKQYFELLEHLKW